MQFKQLRIEAWKSKDFNEVWTLDLAIPVRRANQLSYEATELWSQWIGVLKLEISIEKRPLICESFLSVVPEGRLGEVLHFRFK